MNKRKPKKLFQDQPIKNTLIKQALIQMKISIIFSFNSKAYLMDINNWLKSR
jgi:hypothetical protein